MGDVVDLAQSFDALNLSQGLEAQRIKAAHAAKLTPAGYCLNPRCGDEFDAGSRKLFCGPACEREHGRLTTTHR